MERLHSPWRSAYIQSFSDVTSTESGCVFCNAAASDKDDEHLVVRRGRLAFVIMNLYPYNSGHLMVVPYRHVPQLTDLTEAETSEIMDHLKLLSKALQEISRPEGFNIGSNIGRAGGAGIDQHVHFHIVPRWNGDTNFMPVVADTKIISEDMKATLGKLRKALPGA